MGRGAGGRTVGHGLTSKRMSLFNNITEKGNSERFPNIYWNVGGASARMKGFDRIVDLATPIPLPFGVGISQVTCHTCSPDRPIRSPVSTVRNLGGDRGVLLLLPSVRSVSSAPLAGRRPHISSISGGVALSRRCIGLVGYADRQVGHGAQQAPAGGGQGHDITMGGSGDFSACLAMARDQIRQSRDAPLRLRPSRRPTSACEWPDIQSGSAAYVR